MFSTTQEESSITITVNTGINPLMVGHISPASFPLVFPHLFTYLNQTITSKKRRERKDSNFTGLHCAFCMRREVKSITKHVLVSMVEGKYGSVAYFSAPCNVKHHHAQ